MAEYPVTGECESCGDCCAAGVCQRSLVSRKNLIGIERNGEMEYMVYCDFVYLKDGKFVCKLLEAYAKVGTLDLTDKLDDTLITPAIRDTITSEVDSNVTITEAQVKSCCKSAGFPRVGTEFLSRPSKLNPAVDELHAMCPHCTYTIVRD